MEQNLIKALIEYEGKQYWVDLENKECRTLVNGKLVPTLAKDINFMDILAKGQVISKEKPV